MENVDKANAVSQSHLIEPLGTEALVDECNHLRRALLDMQRPYRYQAAIAAMQGILACDDDQLHESVAKRSVDYADALLLRLYETMG